MNWLTPWRRGAESDELLPIEQLFREFLGGNGRLPSIFSTRFPAQLSELALPRADIAETDKDFLVTLELPGVEENEVDVRIVGSQLVVSGERKQKKEDKDKHYYRMETLYGAFERRFELPDEVHSDPDAVKATFRKGLLEIRVPKVEPRPVAKIAVKSA